MVSTASGEVLPARPGAGQMMRTPTRGAIGLAGLAIVLVGLAAYSNSMRGPFVFDDQFAIRENQTIQHGWWQALFPPTTGEPVTGRPLANLSLAFNYWWDGFNVEGYHAVNIVIHLLAGLTLFGLVRRTLHGPALRAKFGNAALALAFVIALLWTVHPLQTESVTYLVQRAESLMGLFYLLTLYCFVCGTESVRPRFWLCWSFAACLAGMLCKEVMVSAPLMVLLYDRTFVAGTFAGAWRQRGKYYAALAATWLPLAGLVVCAGNRGKSVGFSAGAGVLAYAQSQFVAVIKYIWLSLWPRALVLDYGPDLEHRAAIILPCALVVGVLVGGTIYALWKRPMLGFLGAWFFAILAPSSSIVPIVTQTMAEHRLYLSLGALIVLAVLGLHSLLGQRAWMAGLAVALALAGLTFERNRDYRTEISIWVSSVQNFPDDAAANKALGDALGTPRLAESLASYERTLQLTDTADLENNVGTSLASLGRAPEAISHYQKAIQLDPQHGESYYNLGNAYAVVGQFEQSRGQLEQARSQFEHARDAYAKAVDIDPALVLAHRNLATLDLNIFNELENAAKEYAITLQFLPSDPAVHYDFGLTLFRLNKFDEAAHEFDAALKLQPGYPGAQNNLEISRQRALQQSPK